MSGSSSAGNVCSHSYSFALDNVVRRLLQHPKRIVGEYVAAGNTVIDLGCGPGFFTVEMAKMVGASGTVIAVDLQQEMLDTIQRKLDSTALAQRVILHRCKEASLHLEPSRQADFILAFYMVHEAREQLHLLGEMKQLVKQGGKVLVVEPPFHVSRKKFQQLSQDVVEAGFTISGRPRRKGGRSLLLSS